jgi:hypothetical protein
MCLLMCQIYHIVCGGCACRYVVLTSLVKIEEYHINLVRLRDNFLAQVAVLTKAAVLEAGEIF